MFFFQKKSPLPEEDKYFSEKQIFVAAKQRVADIFYLSPENLELDDIIGEAKLHVSPPGFMSYNGLDILNEDMFAASWDRTCKSVIKKMYPDNTPEMLYTVGDYCEYMVFCYRYCNKVSYKNIIDILSLSK